MLPTYRMQLAIQSIQLLANLIKDLFPRLKFLVPLRHLKGILIDLHTIHVPTLTQFHLSLPDQLRTVILHIRNSRAWHSPIFGIFVDTYIELPARSEEESRVRRKCVSKGTLGALKRLHAGLHVVVDEQDGAFGESVRGDGVGEGEGDVVRGELDVGSTNEDVVNVEVGGSAVEVERHAGGGVAGIAVAASKGAVFDDGGHGDENVSCYRRSE